MAIVAILDSQQATLSLFPIPQTTRRRKSTSSTSDWHIPKIIAGGNKRKQTCHQQHFKLCPCHRHHHPNGLKLHCYQTNKGRGKNDGKSQTAPGLSGHKPRHHNLVQSVGHDYEYIFFCPIFNWGKHAQQSMGAFFMGWDVKDGNLIMLNGAFFTLCAILQNSAAEAKLVAFFSTVKKAWYFGWHSKS